MNDKRFLIVALLSFLPAQMLGGCSFLRAPVDEQAEFFLEGEQDELREPMRPPMEGPRVLVVAMDGVGGNDLRQAIEQGRLANVAELFGKKQSAETYENAFMASDVITTMPSSTIAAWTSIYTGRTPAETGIPGNEWFDRRTRTFLAPSPVSINDKTHMLRMYNDGLINNQLDVPTLYQLAKVRSYVSMAPVFAGADLFIRPDLDELAPVVAAAAEGIVGPDQVEREIYAELDEESADSVTDAIEEHGLADLQVIYFPGIDLFTHAAKDPIEKQRKYLEEVIDPAIGQVLDLYRKHDALEDTYVVFISDHGHTPVLNDDEHALSSGEDGEPTRLLEEAGFRVRPSKLEVDGAEEDYQAVLAYQGATAFVYLADRSTCAKDGERCNWDEPPRFEEDVMPVVHAFYENNSTGAWVPEMADTLDLVLAREPVEPGEPAKPFEVYDGEKLVPVDEYIEKTGRDDLIDLDRRLRELAQGSNGHRAGDVILLSNTGLGRRPEDRYYFSHPYRSWHGSAHEADSLVPLVVARKGESGERLRQIVDEVAGDRLDVRELTPIVLRLLGRSTELLP